MATINRRDFLVRGGLAVAAMGASRPVWDADAAPGLPMCGPRLRAVAYRPDAKAATRTPLNALTLARFADPLPIPPRAEVLGERPNPDDPRQRLPYYRLTMQEFRSQLHRDLAPTRQWGYGGCVPGPTIHTRSGRGLLVEWANALPRRHLLPVDFTIHGADARQPEVRTVAHVHGARVPPQGDGYPERWWTPGHSAVLHYPNQQEAATLWYHDHAMGITRLNLYAGLFGMFLVGDDTEDALPLPREEFDIPLMLYDRRLDHEGQLFYLTSGDPEAPWVPEFYSNTILCNGKLFPYLDVEARPYRLRILNAANGRSFHLTLSSGQPFHQVGSDAGLLAAPVELSDIQLFPAERADVIVDFSRAAGTRVVLHQELQELMQFRVAPATAKDSAGLPARLRPVARMAEADAVKTRILTLGEHDDYAGNSTRVLLNGAHWDDPVTENPVLDSVEIWTLLNLTGDAHPIHLHLVRFQILGRRPFDVFAYNANRALHYSGPEQPPPPQEAGWKDTVRTDAGMATRIIVRFEGYAGRYVWHCHLLEHEDNEMMRPYDVLPRVAVPA